jgi:hypothetical protein
MSLHSTEIPSTSDFGILSGSILQWDCDGLSEFLSGLSDYVGVQPSAGVEESLTPLNLEAIRNEIEQKISDNNDYMKTSESELQKSYFSNLITCGKNILENTSEQVLKNSIHSTEFRKLNFVSSDLKTKRPDLTLRLANLHEVGEQIDIKQCETNNPVQLTEYRLFPWAIVAYIDLKKLNVDVLNYVNQALHFSRCTLLCCPDRKFMVTAVYNIKSVVFCAAVIEDDGTISFFHSPKFSGKSASAQMTVFLTCDRERLGFVAFFPLDLCTPETPLGRGSTSLCLSVKCNDTVVALKISRDSGALQTERTILQYLNSSCQSLAISSISDLQQSMLQQSPSLSSHCIMLTQVFSPFTMKSLKISHLRSVWEILKVVHSLGVCHRDVRVSNIGYCQPDSKHKVVYLMDWSSAKPFRDIGVSIPLENYRQGSTCTASSDVLDRMLIDKQSYECYPADEGISLVYLVIQWMLKDKELLLPRPPQLAKRMWRLKKIHPRLKECIDELRQLTNRYVPDVLSRIDELVGSALEIASNDGLMSMNPLSLNG